MKRSSFRRRLRSLWTIVRGRRRRRRRGRWWRRRPPPEDALVPVGPPKKPPLAGAVALEPPEPEQWDVDAYGRPLPAADAGDHE
jgi:hypothetical protein